MLRAYARASPVPTVQGTDAGATHTESSGGTGMVCVIHPKRLRYEPQSIIPAQAIQNLNPPPEPRVGNGTGADTEKSEGAADPSTDAAKSVAVGVAAGTAVTGATAVGK